MKITFDIWQVLVFLPACILLWAGVIPFTAGWVAALFIASTVSLKLEFGG